MSIGKHGDTPLHKWRNNTLYTPDGPSFKAGDVVHVEIDTNRMIIVLNPADPPEGFKPMDPEE